MTFEIVFLGTGSAVPTAERNHTGILVKTQKETILVDCGEGIQRQFKKAKENSSKLTKILLTHWHADHALGIAGLLYSLGMNDYSKTLEIYGPPGTEDKMKLLEKVYNKFKIPYKVIELGSKSLVFETPELICESANMLHSTTTKAYSIKLKDKLRIDKEKISKLKLKHSPELKKLTEGKNITVNGKKITSKSITYKELGKKVTIILDTGMNKNAIKIAKSSDLLICESTFSKDEETKAKEYMHLTSNQAATIAKKSKSKQLIITHLSQRHEKNSHNLLKEAKKVFTKTNLVKDLERINI